MKIVAAPCREGCRYPGRGDSVFCDITRGCEPDIRVTVCKAGEGNKSWTCLTSDFSLQVGHRKLFVVGVVSLAVQVYHPLQMSVRTEEKQFGINTDQS